jgi:hypothetical protein
MLKQANCQYRGVFIEDKWGPVSFPPLVGQFSG